MGGRGSKSAVKSQSVSAQSQQSQNIQNQVPTAQNTPVTPSALTALSNMTDAELAQLYLASRHAQLPNQLNDVADQTQRFVFQAGLNEKPLVLDTAEFNQFMQDNGIGKNEIMARSIGGGSYTNAMNTKIKMTPQQVADMLAYSRFNYIGGKFGGQAYGAGTYFDMNGGGYTGYGRGMTIQAVLNPKTAKVISREALNNLVDSTQFKQSHPQLIRALGPISYRGNGNASIYALAAGYNVISSSYSKSTGPAPGEYHNVIDRSALVIKKY